MLVIPAQLEKALLPIDCTDTGRVISVNEVQLLKTLNSIAVNELLKVMSFKPVQPWNAP